jgi:hypothetical protein
MVQVQDGSGNPINGNRTIAVELGQGDGDGQLTGDVTIATGSGSTATFTDLGIEGETGNYTLIFRSGTLQPAESQVIAVVNNPPTARDDPESPGDPNYTVPEDGVLNISAGIGVLANDDDPDVGDDLTSGSASNSGDVTLQPTGAFTYTPDPNFNGTETFTYLASDGRGNSDQATVTIIVTPVNDAPSFIGGGPVTTSSVVSSVLGESHPGWATVIIPGPDDESGQNVLFQVSSDAPAGTFIVEPEIDVAGNLTYQPVLRFDTIVVNTSVVALDDGPGTPSSAPQNFTITINP